MFSKLVQGHANLALVALGACVLIALYLISPTFTATHFEVLSAQVQINAIAANEHRLAQANVLYPIHVEYFYLSRIGVVYLVQLSEKIFGNGDVAFRAVTIFAFAIYLAASAAVANRFAKTSYIAATFALLLTPGVLSIGFYFNDNVVSEGFGVLGIALMPAASCRPFRYLELSRAFFGGVLLGLAMLARTDAFLFLPIAASFMWLEKQSWRQTIFWGSVTIVGLITALLIPYLISNVSIIQIFEIDRFFQLVHDDMPRGHVFMVMLALLFLGLPNLCLILMGAVLNLRGKGLKNWVVLAVLPACSFLFFAKHALETRMFFPMLAPFVAMHAGKGLEWIWRNLRPRFDQTSAAPLIGFLLMLVWCAPPIYTPNKEGPRPLLGQMWTPFLWHRWQAQQNAAVQAAQLPIEAGKVFPNPVVVTLDYTSDAFVRLQLWQSGFRPVAIHSIAPLCAPNFEAWQNGRESILMVRTENPHQFVPEPHDYVEALELSAAFECGIVRNSVEVFAYGAGADTEDSDVAKYVKEDIPVLMPSPIWLGWPTAWSKALAMRMPADTYEPMTIVQQHMTLLSPKQVNGLIRAADQETARQVGLAHHALRTLAQLRQDWNYRFWHP
jgi:hypothetical protein